MRICITLDDVIRAKSVQMAKMWKKYFDDKLNLNEIEFTDEDMKNVCKFDSVKEYQKFLYLDYAFEIFVEAPVVEKLLDKNLDLWHKHINDDVENKEDEVELILANAKEFENSIGFSYFFLSKMATHVREIYFPMHSEEIWDKCDVVITANVNILNNKPEGKKSIKIKMPYNEECASDYEYDKLSEFINDKEIINKLKNE